MAYSPLKTALVASWAALHTTQYGFAITSLNGVQGPVTCGDNGQVGAHMLSQNRLKDCVAMTPAQFGLVVSIFTLGGLIGSLATTSVTYKFGRVGTLRVSAALVLLGSVTVGLANNMVPMMLGRILLGSGCGLSTVTVPNFLSEIAPPSIKRSLGIMNQVFIVIGMLAGQSLSFPFGKPYAWRYVLVASVTLAILQLLGSISVAEPEKAVGGGEETDALLGEEGEREPLSIKGLLLSKDPRVTRGFLVVLVTQLSQQLCGVSPVMYFSTRILTPVFQSNSRLVALIIVIIKIPVTILPAFLIERVGSRRLLVFPTIIMSLSALTLAIGINTDAQLLSILGVILFVVSFSVGLGPVTWVVLPEVMPKHAATAAGSVGLALNWTINFCMGAAFLPLQEWMSGGKDSGEGNIFFLFAGACAVIVVAVALAFKARERVLLD
ncbi:hypothetical protein IAT38_004830 [Cryptococcus sp. DSM 104549]